MALENHAAAVIVFVVFLSSRVCQRLKGFCSAKEQRQWAPLGQFNKFHKLFMLSLDLKHASMYARECVCVFGVCGRVRVCVCVDWHFKVFSCWGDSSRALFTRRVKQRALNAHNVITATTTTTASTSWRGTGTTQTTVDCRLMSFKKCCILSAVLKYASKLKTCESERTWRQETRRERETERIAYKGKYLEIYKIIINRNMQRAVNSH